MAVLRTLIVRWRSDSGAEFVEFALAFPLLLLVVLGIVDFGMMFQQYEVITNAAREGARVRILPNYTDADASARAQQYITNAFLSGGGTATITTPAPVNVLVGGNCITTKSVTVSYPHTYLFLSGIGQYFSASLTSQTLHASATMRAEILSGSCP